jgi:hypothetical protein
VGGDFSAESRFVVFYMFMPHILSTSSMVVFSRRTSRICKHVDAQIERDATFDITPLKRSLDRTKEKPWTFQLALVREKHAFEVGGANRAL